MRVGIVGGGLAGCLLAWRLAELPGRRALARVDLLLGSYGDRDATARSGGSVRAYETDPGQRDLATSSLLELLGSPVLRRWTEYREVGSTFVRAGATGLDQELATIERQLPGSVDRVGAAELHRLGWAGTEPDDCAVTERRAGYIDPARLRACVLADLAPRPGVELLDTVVVGLDPDPDPDPDLDRYPAGPVRCHTTLGPREYDMVVLAAGPWTPALLQRLDLPDGGFRTKSIQHVVYTAAGAPTTPFVDGPLDLYGRPTADGRLLLGVPTQHWDVDPDGPPADPALDETARTRATARFPALRLGQPASRVVATDCYAEAGGLALRSLPATCARVATFTGGGGGSAKTVLAASGRAARKLAEFERSSQLSPAGQVEAGP